MSLTHWGLLPESNQHPIGEPSLVFDVNAWLLNHILLAEVHGRKEHCCKHNKCKLHNKWFQLCFN